MVRVDADQGLVRAGVGTRRRGAQVAAVERAFHQTVGAGQGLPALGGAHAQVQAVHVAAFRGVKGERVGVGDGGGQVPVLAGAGGQGVRLLGGAVGLAAGQADHGFDVLHRAIGAGVGAGLVLGAADDEDVGSGFPVALLPAHGDQLFQVDGGFRDFHFRFVQRYQTVFTVQVGGPGLVVLEQELVAQAHQVGNRLGAAEAGGHAHVAGAAFHPVEGVVGAGHHARHAAVVAGAVVADVAGVQVHHRAGALGDGVGVDQPLAAVLGAGEAVQQLPLRVGQFLDAVLVAADGVLHEPGLVIHPVAVEGEHRGIGVIGR